MEFYRYLVRKIEEYGEAFDSSSLAEQFIPYFNNRQRIIVQDEYGNITRGYVGVTTGWRPCFLLLLRSNSPGSSILLSEKDKIIGTVNKYM